eukprot:1740596-Pyramimonas_sp.AAC.1
MASGVFPELAHNGAPFVDEWRANMRGFPLADGLCAVLVEMRADLLEFVSSLGFRRWDNVLNPCMCCNTPKDDMFNFPLSVDTSTWEEKDAHAYENM